MPKRRNEFWHNVNKSVGEQSCWVWKGDDFVFRRYRNGRLIETDPAYYAYSATAGIPKGHVVVSTCGTDKCVRHLTTVEAEDAAAVAAAVDDDNDGAGANGGDSDAPESAADALNHYTKSELVEMADSYDVEVSMSWPKGKIVETLVEAGVEVQ